MSLAEPIPLCGQLQVDNRRWADVLIVADVNSKRLTALALAIFADGLLVGSVRLIPLCIPSAPDSRLQLSAIIYAFCSITDLYELRNRYDFFRFHVTSKYVMQVLFQTLNVKVNRDLFDRVHVLWREKPRVVIVSADPGYLAWIGNLRDRIRLFSFNPIAFSDPVLARNSLGVLTD